MKLADQFTRTSRTVLKRCGRLLPFSPRHRATLPPHFRTVRQSQQALQAAVAEMEKRFLAISTSLENTTVIGRDLVEHGEGLISLALGQGGGQITIETTAEHIWAAIEFVERNVRHYAQLNSQLTRSSQQITRTLAAEQSLSRTLAPLTYVQTLFRVESAACAPEVQTMFLALVHEIDRIRQHVESGFREKFQLIREIQAILDRANLHLLGRQSQAQEAVATLRAQLTQSIDAMKASYERNRDRDTRLANESKAVNQATGQVVISLQFFDILTQKLQHIDKIIADMEAQYAAPPAGKAAVCQLLRRLQQSGRLCDAQLASVETELQHAATTINDGLHRITEQMAALDSDCLALRDFDNVTTGVDGAVQILLDSLVDVHQLVQKAEAHAVDSHQAILPIGGMTTNFTSFIRKLAFEIQLIGLNAEVQAAHVGQGTGLEVLSAQTSAISRDTSQLSTDLAVELDTLTAGLDQVVTSFGTMREENARFSQTLAATIAEDNASLHDYRNSALKVLQHLAELLPQLQEHVQSAAQTADFTSFVTQPLRQLRGAVTSLAAAAGAHADLGDDNAAPPQTADQFLHLYTMRSEIDVHRAALANAPTDAPAAPPAPDNVELFDSPEPAPVAAPPSSAAAPSGEVDLWLDEPAAPATPPPSQPDQRQSA